MAETATPPTAPTAEPVGACLASSGLDLARLFLHQAGGAAKTRGVQAGARTPRHRRCFPAARIVGDQREVRVTNTCSPPARDGAVSGRPRAFTSGLVLFLTG
ncbi:hypothetical protein GCM10010282_68960 [Streptomyces roseolus]|nr:hypothetical protein GCM10010282_68960 [Streptomyces roseolus]